ncbi:MAG TPA: START domain-containing protein [Myxococcota bacterium]|nr:START domain-containing protein [Myxococcota bacterium]
MALLAAFAARAARADESWRSLYRDDGVSVSERDAPGRALPDFRGELEIAADAYEILAVILDVPAQTQWMWQCRESRVLARESDSAQLVYQVLDARWPATDRDVVFRSQARVVGAGRLSVRFASREDASLPPVADLVRMPHLEGEFELDALDATHTRVTYTVAADPGGSLPVAFLRETVRQSPFDTLVGLRRRVADTRGRYADVVAIWRARGSGAR